MKTCKDCLHYEVCNPDIKVTAEMFRDVTGVESCKYFTDRSEWVHLPDEDYIFKIRGDIAKGIIIANCRDAEKKLERMKENDE